jgi:lipooligosaccharide transport system permease protein
VSAPAATRRIGRLERPALRGVLVREVMNFKTFWRSATFSAIVEPVIYLLAFGLGLGALVAKVNGVDYVQYVGTGTVAQAVLFSSAFAGIFSTLVKWKYQNTYSALLAAPVDVEEIVTGESLWIGVRAAVYGCAPLVVAMLFGLRPAPGMLAVPLIGFLTGVSFAAFGIWIAAVVGSFDNTSYIISAVVTPMFLVAGTFFPIDQLPEWAQVAAAINPLYHCVELVRHAAFGFRAIDPVHLAALAAFGLVMWRLAIRRLAKRLID